MIGVVCPCALCENPIPRASQNATMFATAAAGDKNLCPACVHRVHQVPPTLCHRCGNGGAFYRNGSDERLCRSCEVRL